MSKIRVLRILEYIYDSVETMERDMERWHIPPNGSKSPPANRSIIIRSVAMPLETILPVGAVEGQVPQDDKETL